MYYIALLCMPWEYVQLLSFARCAIGKYIIYHQNFLILSKNKKHSTPEYKG